VIEQNREITEDVLRIYLPDNEMETLPSLLGRSTHDQRMFANEREILYQVLFDMRKDMNDLKALVHELMTGKQVKAPSTMETDDLQLISSQYVSATKAKDAFVSAEFSPSEMPQSEEKQDHIEDTQEYVEESLSLQTVEKEVIIKALERNQGKRKLAASELGISERTLYRKINEYGLE
jgi:transcriptional regulator with GAF, ATPase, and Fis domain